MTEISRPSARTARVWAFSAVLAAIGVALQLWVIKGTGFASGSHLPWLGLVAGFVVAEICVVHVTIGREAVSFAFGEIPFVLGLFLVSPGHVVTARVVGGALALVWHRKQTALKLAFNIAQWCFGASTAVAVWGVAAGAGDRYSARGWLSALFAALIVELASVVAITVVIALRGGAARPHGTWTGVATSAANACFALVALDVLRTNWRGIWAVGVLAVVLGLAQRAHVALLRRHDAMERLHSFTRRLGSSDLHLDLVVAEVMTGVRELLEVSAVRLELSAPETDDVRAWLGDAEGVRPATPSATAMLPSLPGSRRRSPKVDSLTVVLHGDSGPMGALSVAGRLGDVGGLQRSDLQLLEAVAGHAAIALHNGRLADRLRDQVEENAHQALHDALTGLPNRLLFDRTATEVLETRHASAVLLLDLDRFKEVNDTLGHAAGDAVLREVGNRLRTVLRDAACVARLGGDEFAVVLAGADLAAAKQCARNIAAALSNRLEISDVAIAVDASIGIALGPEHGHDIATLLRRADVAMYAAKDDRSGVAVYAPERDHHSAEQLSLVSELRAGISNDELVLVYQPKTALSGAIVSDVEALVRWHHPVRGLLTPADFIAVAEQTGLIDPLTDWVLRTALAQCRCWLDAGLDLGVAVNVSPRTLHDPSFAARLADLLDAARVPAAKLTLEITEGALMADPERAIDVLWDLRRAGVRLSVDDLGVGHSSLSYLKRLPVHEIKIDQSFVTRMVDDADDEAIVCAVIDMVHRLRMTVVAEGVEDERTWRRLAQLGADTAQGYWMSRPMPADEVTPWLQTWSQRANDATVIPIHRSAGVSR